MTRCKKTANDKYDAKTPPGFVLHHDTGGMMRLLPKDIHKSVKHTGSAAQHQTRKGKGKC
ncbi:HNH endonuclease [Streptococcus sp. 27098_8_148]|uniref:HNH endonuclease n=1 Tax=Streptococcus sp. 27098_8_148 TaxID=3003652 RepID=UPI00352C1569